MIIAALFNSDDPRFDGYYGPPIRDLLFKNGVLQSSNRHLKISRGDVLIFSYSKTVSDYRSLAEKTYFAGTWSTVQAKRLRATYNEETVCAWVIHNATKNIAEQLDLSLSADDAYLGLLEVDFSMPQHLVFFRNSMPFYCRMKGGKCTRFYSMGNEDEKDEYEGEELLNIGFTNIDWEDRGAHGTIFDDFDTLEHFRQRRQVEKVFASMLPGGEDEASELVMMFEDLNPKLFNVLGSAVRALTVAKNEEDYAHVGISGRRYIEQLADALFPASSVSFRGRDVSASKFKNRIWAYMDNSLSLESGVRANSLRVLGGEVDRLIDAVNALVHGAPESDFARRTFADLAKLTIALFGLDPLAVRQPYRAFEKNMSEFLKSNFEGLEIEVEAKNNR